MFIDTTWNAALPSRIEVKSHDYTLEDQRSKEERLSHRFSVDQEWIEEGHLVEEWPGAGLSHWMVGIPLEESSTLFYVSERIPEFTKYREAKFFFIYEIHEWSMNDVTNLSLICFHLFCRSGPPFSYSSWRARPSHIWKFLNRNKKWFKQIFFRH